jgi:hypothetical protein
MLVASSLLAIGGAMTASTASAAEPTFARLVRGSEIARSIEVWDRQGRDPRFGQDLTPSCERWL